MAIDLRKNKDALLKAYQDVVADSTSTDWAVFCYEGQTPVLKVAETGEGGINEMVEAFNSSKIMYAYCKVMDPNTNLPKYVLINWQGEAASESMKFKCANHLQDVYNFFHGIHVTVNARTEEDVDEEDILKKVSKSSGSQYSIHKEKPKPQEPIAPVGSVYQKIQAARDISQKERDKFWEKTETEEQRRIEEEKRTMLVRQQSMDTERKERETQEQRERERQIAERMKHVSEQKAYERRASQLDVKDQKQQWEKEQEQSYREEEERRLRAEQARKERAAEAERLAQSKASNARSFFQKKASGTSEDQEPISKGRPIIVDDNEEKLQWEKEQEQAYREEEERRLRAEQAQKERVAEAGRLAQSKTSNARSFFQKKASCTSEDQEPVSKGQSIIVDDNEEKIKWEKEQEQSYREEEERRLRTEQARKERAAEAERLAQSKASNARTFFQKKASGTGEDQEPISKRRPILVENNEEKIKWEKEQEQSYREQEERRLRTEQARKERSAEAERLALSQKSNARSFFQKKASGTSDDREPVSKGRAILVDDNEEKIKWEKEQEQSYREEEERRLRAEQARKERAAEAERLTQSKASNARSFFQKKASGTSEDQEPISKGRPIILDDNEEKIKWEKEQEQAYREEEERRLRTEQARKERAAEAGRLAQSQTSNARSFFQNKASSTSQSQEPVSKGRPIIVDDKEEKIKWEREQEQAYKEDEERRLRAENVRKERAAEAERLAQQSQASSNARSFFQKQTGVSRDQESINKEPAPSRKLKPGFEPNNQQKPPASKEPIHTTQREPSPASHYPVGVQSPPQQEPSPSRREPSLPQREPSPLQHELSPPPQREPCPPYRQPSPPRQEPSPPQSPPSTSRAPASLPGTRNLLVEHLPTRQPYSDDEQNDDDWDDADEAVNTPSVPVHHIPVEELSSEEQVERVPDLAGSVPHPGPEYGLCVLALYDYQASDDTEISFDPGDMITQVEQIDEGWWVGVGPDGSHGMFPANFVQIIDQ